MNFYCTAKHCSCMGIKQFSAGKAIRCTAESCENKSEPSCSSCKWYTEPEGVCVNDQSEHVADFVWDERGYLERNALIERIKKAYCDGCENYNGVRCRACGIGDAIDVVEDAPTALERTAEWIAQDEDETRFMCSNCHARNNRDCYNYCPNCGSLMENRL